MRQLKYIFLLTSLGLDESLPSTLIAAHLHLNNSNYGQSMSH